MNSSAGIPLLFVFLWSSGYIAMEYCSAYIEPATFVVVRTAITATVLLYIVLIMRTTWPRRPSEFVHSIVVGILLHGIYTGGSFGSIYYGIDLGLCALIISSQPILTVFLSSIFLGEKITKRKVAGILAGSLGASILILERNADDMPDMLQYGIESSTGNEFLAIALCFLALLAISTATIVQKRYCNETKLMPGTCIQYAAAAIFMIPIALMFETTQVNWDVNFVLGLSWMVIVVSIGAVSLLMILIKNGDAGSVANLFYLITPLVAIEAWILFDEKITLVSLGGMLLCMFGVIVVNYVPNKKSKLVPADSNGKIIFGFIFGKVRVRVDQIQQQ